MGKRFYLLIVFIISVAIFSACNSEQNAASTLPSSSAPALQTEEAPSETEETPNTTEATEEIMICESRLMGFSSEEAFIKYLQSDEKNNDMANLKALEHYYVLKNIPEGYELYKITAGASDIGFWYLPSSRLSSPDSIRAAESAVEHYMLISPREEYKLSTTLSQLRLTEDNLIADGYYYKEASTPELIWEYDGLAMMLSLPKNHEPINAENVERLCEISKKFP